ncbi:TlpA disulfide reductase family protein [Flavobacterium selenitireducens]|uniref:TlpA disulfide reductase family protein n=1 Tax=Flavobacterium selenitireducens TaxID=2722704 RepID=UPI00168B1970|nr:TlpA disulfide reductase family protein [Flavobacterium selenitireducens]MBD3582533.1 AhpC/TSA family protein [Flavobacterium selenitireducens]
MKSVILKKMGQDLRFDSVVEIPVINQKFDYKVAFDHDEIRELMPGDALVEGGGPFSIVFLENGTIHAVINPKHDFSKNEITGGKHNDAYRQYVRNSESLFRARLNSVYARQDSLRDIGSSHSNPMKKALDKRRDARNEEDYQTAEKEIAALRKNKLDKSPEGLALDRKAEVIYSERRKFQQKFIEQNRSLPAYYLVMSDLMYDEQPDIQLAKENQKSLANANPGHPYNAAIDNLVNGIEQIKVGGTFVDFTAPDLNGKKIVLSEQIKNKMILLDLWATWCSSCIRHTREMLPVYQDFKNKGFDIVGVAGEFKNSRRLVKFLEEEKWPWLHLLELDRENGIWEKYNVGNGGGGIFLIDPKGKIVAINPSADEVRNELEKRL